MKKIIVGLIIISVVSTGFIALMFIPRNSPNDQCVNSTKPEMFTPVQVLEGITYTIRICGLQPDHVYQLRENNYITTDIWFTGLTNHTIYRTVEESSFINDGSKDDGLLYLSLWDNTTQTVLVKRQMIALIQIGEPPTHYFMWWFMLPILAFGLIVSVIVAVYKKIDQKVKKEESDHN